MPRRGEAASEFGRASFEKEFGATNAGFSRGMGDPISPSPLQVLSKTNYPIWAIRMQVHLEAYGLWEAIESDAVPRKKDRQALSVIFGALSEDIVAQLDISKTAKEIWEFLKTRHMGAARVIKARVQALRREFETMFMGEEESVADFPGKLSKVATQLRSLGEKIDDGVLVAKLLRAAPANFDAITSSIEQFGDMDSMSLEEAIGSLKIYEEKLQDREARREEQLLLSKAAGKQKKYEESSTRGRGRGRGWRGGRGRGRGDGKQNEHGDEERPRDKSKVKCYNCEKLGHFAYECRKSKKEEKVQVAEVEEKPQSTLLMAIIDTSEVILLQGVNEQAMNEGMWYLDNGASNHMTGDRHLFQELKEVSQGIERFGDGSTTKIGGRGWIMLQCQDGGQMRLDNVLYVPELKANILSLGQFDEHGCRILMEGGFLTIYDQHGRLLVKVKKTLSRLYLLKLNLVLSCMVADDSSELTWTWHIRYGHLNFQSLRRLSSKEIVRGLPKLEIPENICRDCIASKQHRSPFPSIASYRASRPLELVHGDICGPISPATLGGSKYFLLLVDDYSRLMWVAMIKNKSEAFQAFVKFKNLAEAEKGMKIGCLRTDQRGEFTSSIFSNFCSEHGIKRQFSAPYSPQQNGVVERRNRTVMNMVRSMLKDKNLPHEL